MESILEKTETREWLVVENNSQNIFAVLHRPTAVENPPIVITMHGFASSKHGSNRGYVRLAEALTQEGIACLRFDFRGSGDSEGNLSDLTLEDLISDAVAICSSLKKIDRIDAERVGIFGASLGGSIAIQSSIFHQMIKALVLWAPVASGELWYRDFIKMHPELMKMDPLQALGAFKGIRLNGGFREQFGKMHTDVVLASCALPTLHMHGELDAEISVEHQKTFQKACFNNPNIRFLSYPEVEHAFGKTKVFPQAVKETIEWFKNYL